MHWYQLSASNGDASALVNMGVLYITGTGVKQDVSHAARVSFRMQRVREM
jgi:TPR repeat protein